MSLSVAIERRNKKDLVAEVASLVGTPTALPVPGRCQRTFNALTKILLADLHHKDPWMYFLEKFSEGESVRKAAWRCGNNTKAAFLWRHRFLVLPACLKARKESGIVENDETWFLRSYKGQRGGIPRRARKRGAGPQGGGSSGNRFPSWSCGIVRERLPTRFRRTTIGRSKRCLDPSWPGMPSFARTGEEKALSPWPLGRWGWPIGR